MNIIKIWNEKPLIIIMSLGIFFRLLAVIFSKGYAMLDDHFLIIEQSQMWIDNCSESKWLPSSGIDQPSGHSLFYVGVHYILFKILEWLTVFDPEVKMFIIRFLHAIYSLLIIIFGYKIAKHYGGIKNARVVGLLLSILWLFPFLSVRNLVEFTCIPLFLWGLWITIKNITNYKNILIFIVSGFICGLSFSIRFQAVLLVFGLFTAIVFSRKWFPAIMFGIGATLSFIIIQGIIDYSIWGKPFAEFFEYMKYNLENRYNYFTGNWYNYIFLILGLLIPPLSFFLFFGWVRVWKKYSYVFLPAFLFLLFHLYFPNRQERFILPVLPLIIIAGILGWNDFFEKSKFWRKRTNLYNTFWISFWAINIILLIPLSLTYTKRSYVEAMNYLRDKNHQYTVVDDMNNDISSIMPRFYLKDWKPLYYSSKSESYTKLIALKENLQSQGLPLPKYYLFLESENIQSRVDSISIIFPNLVKDTLIEPGFIDKVMHYLNKRNKNQTIIIYKRND